MTRERAVKHGYEDLTILELVLQLHGEFRRSLEPIRVTPLQAGVLLFIRRHANARMTDTATALCLRLPTLSEVVKDLVRKRWVTRRRSVTDTRVVHLSLSRRGNALALQINQRVRQVNAPLAHRHARPAIRPRLHGVAMEDAEVQTLAEHQVTERLERIRIILPAPVLGPRGE